MQDLVQKSLSIFPAGSNGEFNLPADLARVIVRGEGCEVWTSDGRRLLDFSIGWGSALVGHGRPEIVEAIREQAPKGTNFAYVTDQSLRLAEEVLRVSPACETLRFCVAGTEATMYCMRLARAHSGKPKILKFEGAYHGAHDTGLVSLLPKCEPEYPVSEPFSSGVSPSVGAETLVAPFNDLQTTCEIIDQHAHELAGVIVEPLQRCTPPVPGFLAGLREATREAGVLLIFDEVVTGFRLAYGGAQEYYGVVPDLVAYGKAIGGGTPLAAFGGRRDVVDLVREDRLGSDTYVWMASTLGGNPISTAAGNAALAIYRQPGTYEHLHNIGAYLRSKLKEILEQQGVEAQVVGDGPLAQVIFGTGEALNFRTSQHDDPALARRLMLDLFERGIFLNPMSTKLYLSLAHQESHCDEFCEVFADALQSCTATAAV